LDQVGKRLCLSHGLTRGQWRRIVPVKPRSNRIAEEKQTLIWEDIMTAPTLGFAPNEDPFVVQHGGFYRRWLSMLDDIDELKTLVARIEATTEDKWVPVWREAGKRHEDEGDRLAAA